METPKGGNQTETTKTKNLTRNLERVMETPKRGKQTETTKK